MSFYTAVTFFLLQASVILVLYLTGPWIPFSVAFLHHVFPSSTHGLVFLVLRWIHQASCACLLWAAYGGRAEGKGGERRPSRLLANDRYRPSAILVSFPTGSSSDFFKLCICCICMRVTVCVCVCRAFLPIHLKIRVVFLFFVIQSLAATGRSWTALKQPVNGFL